MTKERKLLIVIGTVLAIVFLSILVKIIAPAPPLATDVEVTKQPEMTIQPEATVQPSLTVQPDQTIQPNATKLPNSSRWYDPALLKIGDVVGGWKVLDLHLETYGKGSKIFIMEGEAQISGTFSINYEEDTYNSNQIILLADEASSNQLPQPLAFKGRPSRLILQISNPDVRKQLGAPGSKGYVTVTIHRYQTVYADILEGVSDTAIVTQISQIETTPPPLTEVTQTELTQALNANPLVPIKLSTNDITAPSNYGLLQEWFQQLSQQFRNGLSPFTLKRISPDQKEQIQKWLQQAFTENKAKEIAASNLQQSGIHHIVGGSLLPIRPFSEVKDIQHQAIQMEGSNTLRYTGVYILSGTNDAHFTYTWKKIDGVWKIDQMEMKLM